MDDDMRAPVGKPMNDEPETGEGDVTQRDAEEIKESEVEEIDEQVSDDPVVEEESETSYDPATQAPKEAQR